MEYPYPDFSTHAFFCKTHGFVDARGGDDDDESTMPYCDKTMVCEECRAVVEVQPFDEMRDDQQVRGVVLQLRLAMRRIGITLCPELLKILHRIPTYECVFDQTSAIAWLHNILYYRYEEYDISSILSNQIKISDACRSTIESRFVDDGALYCVLEYLHYALEDRPFPRDNYKMQQWMQNKIKKNGITLTVTQNMEEWKKTPEQDDLHLYIVISYDTAIGMIFEDNFNCIMPYNWARRGDFGVGLYLYERLADAMHASIGVQQSAHGMAIITIPKKRILGFKYDMRKRLDRWDLIVNRRGSHLPLHKKYANHTHMGPISRVSDDGTPRRIVDTNRGYQVTLTGHDFTMSNIKHMDSVIIFLKDKERTFAPENVNDTSSSSSEEDS